MVWDPTKTTTIRRSIYFKESTYKALKTRGEVNGGLTKRIASVTEGFSVLFDDASIRCSMLQQEWLDLYPVITEYLRLEDDWRKRTSLGEELPEIGNFEDVVETLLLKTDSSSRIEHIQSIVNKIKVFTPADWVVLWESHYRYTTARLSGMSYKDSWTFTFPGIPYKTAAAV